MPSMLHCCHQEPPNQKRLKAQAAADLLEPAGSDAMDWQPQQQQQSGAVAGVTQLAAAQEQPVAPAAKRHAPVEGDDDDDDPWVSG